MRPPPWTLIAVSGLEVCCDFLQKVYLWPDRCNEDTHRLGPDAKQTQALAALSGGNGSRLSLNETRPEEDKCGGCGDVVATI